MGALDELMAAPRNPARAPQPLEDLMHSMFVQPAMDIGMGVGSMAGGQGWTNPEALGGLTAAMGLLTPMKAGALGPKAGIRAYHGSPHDFDKFDLSKIGTGEGNQMYGHGLYFAENPKVAESYKMTGDARFNRMTTGSMTPHQEFAHDLASSGRSEMDIMGSLAQKYGGNISFEDASRIAKEATAARGKMYEVNINAKPEQFLDWDRPIGQQGQPVQGSLQEIAPGAGAKWTGEELYKSLAGGPFGRKPDAATGALRDAGIPGIRYLDQGSRLTGSSNVERLVESHGSREKAMEFAQSQLGKFAPDRPTHKYWADIAQELKDYKPRTSNYVLFNDQIIDIMKKWGLAAGPLGALMFGNDSQAAPMKQ